MAVVGCVMMPSWRMTRDRFVCVHDMSLMCCSSHHPVAYTHNMYMYRLSALAPYVIKYAKHMSCCPMVACDLMLLYVLLPLDV